MHGTCGNLIQTCDAHRVSEHHTLIGKVFHGRYRIEAELGEGGMGSVYRAEHIALSRTVAVKVLRDELAGSAEFRQRFEREATVLSGLSHPNIVSVLDYGFEEGLPFLVMEFLEGRDFNDVLDEGRLSIERADTIARQLLRAVGHAHSLGLVHRDLKPQNVVIRRLEDEREHVTVLDFGLARQVEEGGPAVTKTGLMMGTPAYMSPEQVGGRSDARSDVYSLGVMLYEMFAGRHPYKGVASAKLLHAHLVVEPPPLAQFAMVDDVVATLVGRAMAKDPSARFADANEMLTALGAAGRESPTKDVAPPAVTQVGRAAAIEGQETVGGRGAPRTSSELSGTEDTRLEQKPSETRLPDKRRAMALGGALATLVAFVVVAALLSGDAPETVHGTTTSSATSETPAPAAFAGAVPSAPEAAPPSRGVWDDESGYEDMLLRLRRGRGLRDRQHRSLAVRARRNPNDVRPLLLLAHSYVLGRSLTDGLERYEAALEIEPNVANEPWTAEDLITIAAAESLHQRASTLILQHYEASFASRVETRAAAERDPWQGRLNDLARRLLAR
ncbi:MAG: serine/threonine protein kinase [Polyangiales bacterium]|jgi:serine/threonine protein kinase